MVRIWRAAALMAVIALLSMQSVNAGDVVIRAAEFTRTNGLDWQISVTLAHADSGWEHYADRWRVVDGNGRVLGDRVLHHPHVNEQPFTRSLRRVRIPDDMEKVFVEAHDKVHGWAGKRLEVDLGKARNGALRVEAP